MNRDAIQQRFAAALETLVTRLQQDRSVAAAILCGSLSHDTVWEKSDIDLVVVTVDGKPIRSPFLALTAEGVNIHASSALWILYTATPLAQVEVIAAGELVGREVILRARALAPGFFDTIYTRLLNEPKTRPRVEAALAAIDAYLAAHTSLLFAPVVEHLREAGETRSSTEIEHHFARHFGIEGVVTACEYLADRGLIGRGATPVRLTRSSQVDLQELAFFHTGDLVDGA